MNLVPMPGRIVVKPVEAERVSKGGIHLPDTAQKKSSRGKVLAVGGGKPVLCSTRGTFLEEPCIIKEGQTVLYTEWAGSRSPVDGEDYLILNVDEVLAVVE